MAESEGGSCEGGFFDLKECGATCDHLISWDHSTVRLPDNLMDYMSKQPLTHVSTEYVCMGLEIDEWWKAKTAELLVSKEFGDIVPTSFFGAEDGTMRMYPARHSRDADRGCTSYDNRRRPWFVAASSGPKDLILGKGGCAHYAVTSHCALH